MPRFQIIGGAGREIDRGGPLVGIPVVLITSGGCRCAGPHAGSGGQVIGTEPQFRRIIPADPKGIRATGGWQQPCAGGAAVVCSVTPAIRRGLKFLRVGTVPCKFTASDQIIHRDTRNAFIPCPLQAAGTVVGRSFQNSDRNGEIRAQRGGSMVRGPDSKLIGGDRQNRRSIDGQADETAERIDGEGSTGAVSGNGKPEKIVTVRIAPGDGEDRGSRAGPREEGRVAGSQGGGLVDLIDDHGHAHIFSEEGIHAIRDGDKEFKISGIVPVGR